jgi:hypothetical protein
MTALKGACDPHNHIMQPGRNVARAMVEPLSQQGIHTILGPGLHSPLTTLLHWSILRSISSCRGIRGHSSVLNTLPRAQEQNIHCTSNDHHLANHPTINTNYGFWDMCCPFPRTLEIFRAEKSWATQSAREKTIVQNVDTRVLSY